MEQKTHSLVETQNSGNTSKLAIKNGGFKMVCSHSYTNIYLHVSGGR